MPTIQNKIRSVLHRKQQEVMSLIPSSTTAGKTFIAPGLSSPKKVALYIDAQTVAYIYNIAEDAWAQIASPALTSAVAAGACGEYHPNGPTGTTSAGGASSITTNFTTITDLSGFTIRLTGGTGAGQERVIASHLLGSNTLFNVTAPWDVAPDATTTWMIRSGRYYFLNGGTVAAAQWRVYDYATASWSSLGTTGLPASFGTDGNLLSNCTEPFVTGTATGGGASTLTNSAKTWTSNQWSNAQVRILSGTGAGQIRTISSNTGDTLTVSAPWTTPPDASSVYVIEGNEDFLYLTGNNATPFYRFSISGNTWTTLTARGVLAAVGVCSFVANAVNNPLWVDESNYLNGRYIYSFRGGNGNAVDRYDIASNSWTNAISYAGAADNLTTGSTCGSDGRRLYIHKDGVGRILAFDPVQGYNHPIDQILYPGGTATVGTKVFLAKFSEGDTELLWLYTALPTTQILVREMLYG